MTLKEFIEITGFSCEELASSCGVDIETFIKCVNGIEPKDSLPMQLIKNILELAD